MPPSSSDTESSSKAPKAPPPLYGPDGEEIVRPRDPQTGKPLPCYVSQDGVAILNKKNKPVPLKFSSEGKPIPLEKAYPDLAEQNKKSSGRPPPRQNQYQAQTTTHVKSGGCCSCCCGDDEEVYTTTSPGGNKVIVTQPRAQYVSSPVYAPAPVYPYGGYRYGYDPYYESRVADAALIGLAAGSMMHPYGYSYGYGYDYGFYDDWGYGGYDYDYW